MEMSKLAVVEKVVFSLFLVVLIYGVSQGSMPIMISLLIFGIIYQSFLFFYKKKVLKENIAFERMWVPMIASVVLLVFIIWDKYLP